MRRALRITLWIIGGLFFLIFAIAIFITTDSGKEFVRKRTIAFLENKLKTEVRIGELDYDLPKMIVMRDILMLDKAKDTLLSAGELKVDIALLELFSSNVDIQRLYLKDAYSHLYRTAPDTTFNFDYVVKAFLTQGADTTGAVTDTTARMELNLKEVVLDNVRFRMDDEMGGSKTYFDVGNLHLTMKHLDLEQLVFNGERFYGDSITAVIINDKSHLPPDTAAIIMPYIAANEIQLKNISYNQQDLVNGFYMNIDVGNLVSTPAEINLPGQSIVAQNFNLENSAINIRLSGRSAELAEQAADSLIQQNAATVAKWYASSNDLNFNNVQFIFNNETVRRTGGLDFNHLNLTGIVLDAENFSYTTDTIAADINHFTAREQSGFHVHELQTSFAYHPQGGYLRDLYLQTNNTILRDYVEFKYPSIEVATRNPSTVQLQANLQNSIIGISDLLLVAPQLKNDPFFRKNRNGKIKVDAIANGSLATLNLQKFNASGLGNTEISATGQLQNLMDPNKLSYNLKIQRFQSTRNDIETLLPPATLAQIRLPDRFGATGTLSGTAQTFKPNLLIASSDGNAAVRGTISMAGGTGRETYDLSIKTQRLNLGRILRQNSNGIGFVTADIKAKGRSFDINTMNAVAKGTIHSITYNGNTYKNLSFDGNIAGKIANVQVDANDPGAQFNLTARIDLRGDKPSITTQGNIRSLDLYALGLYPSEFKIQGDITVNIVNLDPDYPHGTVSIGNPIITLDGKTYVLDTLYIAAKPSIDSGNNILIAGDAIYAHLWGHTPLTRVGDIVEYHINRHYVLNDSIGRTGEAYRRQYNIPQNYDLQLIARVYDHPVVLGLVPDLKSFDTLLVEAGLRPERVFANVDAGEINYANYRISDTKVRVNGDDAAMTYTASVRHIKQKTMDIWFANAAGEVRTNMITSAVSIADADSNKKFGLYATMQQEGRDNILQFQRGLMLNYQEWDVNEPNRVVFGPGGFYVENFGIRNGSESIIVNSQSATYNAPLRADISNFMLANLTNIISGDTLLANGVLNGHINLTEWDPNLQLTSVMTIDDFSMRGDTIGDVALDVHNATLDAIDASAVITGYGNNVVLKGLYYPTAVNGNNFNMNLNLNPLNVSTIEGAAMNTIKNTSGYLRGQLAVKGTFDAPLLTGELRTDSLSTNVAMLNTQFLMPYEALRFNGQNILLNDFRIYDVQGNPATVSGRINMATLTNPDLALSVNAENWQAMNSTARENEEFYGQLFLSADMTIKGSISAPAIDGSVTILDDTKLTVVIPQYETGIQDREGIVAFVDMSDPNRYKNLYAVATDTTIKRVFIPPGADINLNVSTNENAEFNLIVDQGTGDFVKVRGKADLNTAVTPDGTLGVVGTYEIVDGSYHFNYNFIRRLFKVQPGSKIVFSGDPLEAEVDATAVYEANVPPYELVARQISDPSNLVYYQQRLPFEIQLQLNGEIMQPEITFDIVLPEDKRYRVSSDVEDVVQARLSQIRQTPSELNKQVFAVIVLNRFVGENLFESGVESGGLENVARQSVSRFVSEQLNEMAGGLVGGLDLTVDLNTSEDFTTGERRNRTDLSVGASKRLLDDRLTITVGNNFQVEGPQASSTQNSSLIPGNLMIDYDLSRDRTFRIRFFRRTDEISSFEGNVVETGASFIMQKDYNRLSQLFMSAKKKARMREERIREVGASEGGQAGGNNNTDSLQDHHSAILVPKREETVTNLYAP